MNVFVPIPTAHRDLKLNALYERKVVINENKNAFHWFVVVCRISAF